MKNTKSIFIFLILIFPVLIYLFLQGFGKNQFAIPIYFEEGVSDPFADCPSVSSVKPYQLNEGVLNDLFDQDETYDEVTVYELGNTKSEKLRNNLYTFLEKYKSYNNVNLRSLRRENDTSSSSSRYPAWEQYYLADSQLMRFGRCILQLDLNAQIKADSGLVLVDQQQQIRGYYDPMILKEIDRLNTELYILLSE